MEQQGPQPTASPPRSEEVPSSVTVSLTSSNTKAQPPGRSGTEAEAGEADAGLEEFLKRVVPQQLLEHMKLYGYFDRLRSALTKDLVSSGLQGRLVERTRAIVESTRAFAHAPSFDPAIPAPKRVQQRRTLISRITDELQSRTPLHKEIEKGIQGVVLDPASAFYNLAQEQINEALTSFRATASQRKESALPVHTDHDKETSAFESFLALLLPHDSSLTRRARVYEAEKNTKTSRKDPSQLLDEMLGASRRVKLEKTTTDPQATNGGKRKRTEDAVNEASLLKSNSTKQEDAVGDIQAKRQRTDQSSALDQEPVPAVNVSPDEDEGSPSSASSSEAESDSESSESSPESGRSEVSSSEDDDGDAREHDSDNDESEMDADVDIDGDSEEDQQARARTTTHLEEEEIDVENHSESEDRMKTRSRPRRAPTSSSSEDELSDNRLSDNSEEGDHDDRREAQQTSLSSRRRRTGRRSAKTQRSSKSPDNEDDEPPRPSVEDDAALARMLAEQESARMYSLRRRTPRGR